MSKFTELELKQGMHITYILRSDQLPVHPEREWRGKIRCLFPTCKAVEVEVLDEGYEGNAERVDFEQIIRIEGDY